MKYMAALENGDPTAVAYSVVIPDLPGCFSAGDSFEEALKNAKEAAELWMESELDAGRGIPQPSSFNKLKADPDLKGCIWAVIDVNPEALSDKAERVNITLPARVLKRLDRQAKSCGETRSGYIARMVVCNPVG